jgi:hypothetical protein
MSKALDLEVLAAEERNHRLLLGIPCDCRACLASVRLRPKPDRTQAPIHPAPSSKMPRYGRSPSHGPEPEHKCLDCETMVPAGWKRCRVCAPKKHKAQIREAQKAAYYADRGGAPAATP